MMDSSNYDHLPVELRTKIYTYLPQTRCVVCNKMTVNFDHITKGSIACSLRCLYIFNTRTTKNIVVYRGITLVQNTWLALNVVAIYVLFGTYLGVVACSYLLDYSIFTLSYPVRLFFAMMATSTMIRNQSIQSMPSISDYDN